MAEEERFFMIEIDFVGPHPSQKGHRASMVEVSPKPGCKNMSGEPCERGWLGTTDDWDRQAVGVYNEAAARKMLTETYKIKLPDTSPVKYGKYCHSHKNAEGTTESGSTKNNSGQELGYSNVGLLLQ